MHPIKTHEMLAGGFASPAPKPYNTEIPTYDDEDEWEYEYSTTETETYYLTLDLSIPEFTTRDSRTVVQAGRGGYLSSWIGDPEKVNDKSAGQKARYRFAADDIDEEDDHEPPEREDQDPDDADLPPVDPALSVGPSAAPDTGTTDAPAAASTQGEIHKAQDAAAQSAATSTRAKRDDADMGEVQILELHSKTPIIAYRGRIFEGQWAENAGTEMIFAPHEEGDDIQSLPRLDSLPGGVDLLAASSARLLTTERKIQPRLETNLDEAKAQMGIRVVVGRDLNGDRRKQATFLENLMAVKRIKGEPDAVPVFARPPPNKDFRDDRDPDWKPRRRKLRPVEALPRIGRTAIVSGAPVTGSTQSGKTVDKGKNKAVDEKDPAAKVPELGMDTDEGAEAQAEETRPPIIFQPPWEPRVTNGPTPFFSTPQFRPSRKRQQLPGAEEPKKPQSKTNLPVSRSARTALLSEDHGVSVSKAQASESASLDRNKNGEKDENGDQKMGGV
ncbi:hypothetical protein BROUX41_001344 [Berkeleyomyces rouxiae]|uniref:uncharacterized protein n=1 Tax=Berkeleyomyces rouxiae TaxID=2035830 RepID=UPI003B7EAE1C